MYMYINIKQANDNNQTTHKYTNTANKICSGGAPGGAQGGIISYYVILCSIILYYIILYYYVMLYYISAS